MPSETFKRHKTAINRGCLSRPIRLALDAQMFAATDRIFDYGCGRGNDLAHLAKLGYAVEGWDPVHRPETNRHSSDVVNLGYVINVIEDPHERAEALRSAWHLAEKLLIVAARLEHDLRDASFDTYGDGCVTGWGTFQKLYKQLELRDWIDQTLGERSLPAAPGVFFVFRDHALREAFLQVRYRRIRSAPKPRISDVLFEQHQEILQPLMDFVAARGRLPVSGELVAFREVEQQLGSVRRAFAVVRRVTGPERWEQIQQERNDELVIRFALDRFGGRPRFSDLPEDVQADVREFFGTYTKACAEGDRLLFRAGKMDELEKAMRQSEVGKLTGNALYIHADAVDRLPTLLKVYEGCAQAYLGHVEGANIIKLSREQPKVSYLFYPDFDSDPHPALRESLRLRLSNADVKYLDYSKSENPFILHRKEEFLAPDDPRREKFTRLTVREEQCGLYEDSAQIGTRAGWEQVLREHSVRLHGHRLCRDRRTAPTDPGATAL